MPPDQENVLFAYGAAIDAAKIKKEHPLIKDNPRQVRFFTDTLYRTNKPADQLPLEGDGPRIHRVYACFPGATGYEMYMWGGPSRIANIKSWEPRENQDGTYSSFSKQVKFAKSLEEVLKASRPTT